MYKIHNWSRYQSYKDRKPPWIRFHREMLDDFKFHRMSVESRAMLPMLWLLACEDKDPTSGKLPPIDEVAFRLRYSESVVKKVFKELENSGFIECNGIVTESLLNCNQSVTPETETETDNKVELFAKFRQSYPLCNRNFGAVKKAEDAFRVAMKKDTFENILKGVENYAAYLRSTGQSNADAFRWLQDERWGEDYRVQKLNQKPTRKANQQAGELMNEYNF